MGSKSITISDDAYEYLKAMKREGESFSDVILSLRKRKEALLEHWGAFVDEDLSGVERARQDLNDGFRERSHDWA